MKYYLLLLIMQSLEWAYTKAVNGVVGVDSAEELAQDYLKKGDNLQEQINHLIRWQDTKAGASDFLTGISGILTIPVVLPTNITSVFYIQLRMIAAIAIMCGYDVKDDKVKTLAYSCLVAFNGNHKESRDKKREKIAVSMLKKLPGTLITKINQAVGFY